ncbi:MAG: hypothetical protein EOP62_17075 [Sphingomonadales bacterium]|nr:MAG: hypothetical protein EOP62_17075 [Sphingomonadales bacterium]
MKIIKLVTAAAVFSIATPALAELPPAYQRAVEIKAIVNHDDLVAAFPQDALIEQVLYVSKDLYRVKAGKCVLDAKIVGKALPEGMVGARQFDVVLGKAVCAG